MEIPIIKQELAGALSALGKLVSRKSLIKAYQGIEIEGKANYLYFRTRNVIEQIEFRLFAELEDDFTAILVDFEQFRQAVRNCKNKTLKFEIDCREVFIDDVKMAPVKGSFPQKEQVPDQDICVMELPSDTLSALSLLAPITDRDTNANKRADTRRILTGINISGDGFTATDGKELSNIPLNLGTNGSITIPFPLALLATKAFGESGRLCTWQKNEDTHFDLTLGEWTWSGKALNGNYPKWKQIVPERTDATHYVNIQDDQAEHLMRYLKNIPDDPRNFNSVKVSRLPDAPDNFHLESSNGMLFNIHAEFDPNWNGLAFRVRKEFLLHLLDAGHRKIELNDELSPIVGTGGCGKYITMPIRSAKPKQEASNQMETQTNIHPEQDEPQTIREEEETVSVQNPPHPQESTPQNPISNTNLNKENPTMETNNITHVVSAPVQTFTPNHESAKALPSIDELIAGIEAFKSTLKTLSDESAVMSRRIREFALAQRQKDREYKQTKRTLDRVRVASGVA